MFARNARSKSDTAMQDIYCTCTAEPRIVVGDDLARQAVEMHRAVCRYAVRAASCKTAAGAAMLKKKQELGHGNGFTEWKESLGIPARTCNRYMALARDAAATGEGDVSDD